MALLCPRVLLAWLGGSACDDSLALPSEPRSQDIKASECDLQGLPRAHHHVDQRVHCKVAVFMPYHIRHTGA